MVLQLYVESKNNICALTEESFGCLQSYFVVYPFTSIDSEDTLEVEQEVHSYLFKALFLLRKVHKEAGGRRSRVGVCPNGRSYSLLKGGLQISVPIQTDSTNHVTAPTTQHKRSKK